MDIDNKEIVQNTSAIITLKNQYHIYVMLIEKQNSLIYIYKHPEIFTII